MFTTSLTELRKRLKTKKNLQGVFQRPCYEQCCEISFIIFQELKAHYEAAQDYFDGNKKCSSKKSQFHLLTYVIKRNTFASNDTFNKLRKKSKTKQSLRSACQWLYYTSCCRRVGWAIWHISSPSFPISLGSSTGWEPCTYCRANYTYDHQNSPRHRSEDSYLCSYTQSDYRRPYNSFSISLPCKRGLSWLRVSSKIVRFFWNHILIVTWKKNLSKPMRLLFQSKVALWENFAY
jgi:hypothetical protein